MKFNVVIGNPPYNKGLYKEFIQLADDISKTGHCMIVPNTWSDKKDTVLDIIAKKCTNIIYFINTNDVFNIQQFGGINIYYCSQNKLVESTCVVENRWNSNNIHNNTLNRQLLFNDSKCTLLNGAFKIVEKILKHNEYNIVEKNQIQLDGNIYKADELLYSYDNINYTGENKVKVYKSGEYIGDIHKKLLPTQYGIDKYKLCVHERLGFGGLASNGSKLIMLKELHGLKPDEIPTWPYLTLAFGDTPQDLEPFYKYYHTKFFRFLVFAANTSSHYVRKEMWRFVPAIDNNINWSLSVEEIDRQLYKKYGLDSEDIQMIEGTIKDMSIT